MTYQIMTPHVTQSVKSLGLGFGILDQAVHHSEHILVGIGLDDFCDKFLSGLCVGHHVVVDHVVHCGHIVCICLKHAVAHDIVSLTDELFMLFIQHDVAPQQYFCLWRLK